MLYSPAKISTLKQDSNAEPHVVYAKQRDNLRAISCGTNVALARSFGRLSEAMLHGSSHNYNMIILKLCCDSDFYETKDYPNKRGPSSYSVKGNS